MYPFDFRHPTPWEFREHEMPGTTIDRSFNQAFRALTGIGDDFAPPSQPHTEFQMVTQADMKKLLWCKDVYSTALNVEVSEMERAVIESANSVTNDLKELSTALC